MIDRLKNSQRASSHEIAYTIENVKVGVVTGNYDPDTYMCRVQFPDGSTSGWLPIASPWVGDGWGLFSPPSPGSTVLVLAIEGSLDASFVIPGLFLGADRPIPTQQGEFKLIHKTGAAIEILNDGTIRLSSPEINLNGYVKTSNHVSVASGASGVFTDKAGKTITVKNGIIVGIK